MSAAAPASGSWADVVGEGRLPLFILICLAVWLNAADSLITATIMPSVGRSLGGYVYFGWATAGYLLGSVLAGASSGVLALRFGLRSAVAVAALIYAAGCVLSAVAPEIFTFLLGRVLQGFGGGWVVGLCTVAIGLLFANRLLPRVFSAISSVWGIAVIVGPMLGGVFADSGAWRAVFWLFAVQGVAVAVAARFMLPAAEASGAATAVAWRQLGLVALGVMLIALADLAGDFARTAFLTAAGVAVFVFTLRLDGRSAVSLLPRGSSDLRTVHGAGYATMFLLNAASMGLLVYGPAVLQTLRGLSALAAGYVVGAEAVFWTAASLPVAGLTGPWPGRLIRLGVAIILVGLALCAAVFDGAHLAVVVAAAGLIGCGFGLSWAFLSQGILGALADEERALGGAGIATVRLVGAAAGSAMAAAVANLSGFAGGFTVPAAQAAGVWVFAAGVPLAALACLASWRLGATTPVAVVAGRGHRPAPSPASAIGYEPRERPMQTMAPPLRAVLGFIAAALSVLIFHQGAWALLHAGGLMPPPYPMAPVAPWGVPQTIDFCFWGGVYGALYGLVLPRLAMPPWLSGLILGVIASLVLWFVVAPLKGRPVGFGWSPHGTIVVLVIHAVWGIGVGLILPLFRVRAPRALRT